VCGRVKNQQQRISISQRILNIIIIIIGMALSAVIIINDSSHFQSNAGRRTGYNRIVGDTMAEASAK